MATTTVTGPDGKDYEITHPDGASEADILAYAKQHYGGQTSAEPATGFFDAIRKAKGRANQIIEETGARKSVVGPLITSMIPETPGQAVATGLMSATAPFTGPLAGIGRAAPPLARVLLGAGAGAAGSAIDEGDPLKGAVTGGAMTGAIESAVPMASKLARSLPWMKGLIASWDAKRIGKMIEGVVPQLRGARTAADLQNLGRVASAGKSNLSSLFQDLEAQIGHVPINVPSISAQPVTVSEALHELTKAGAAGYAPNWSRIDPMVRTSLGMDARALRTRMLEDIRQEMQRLGTPVVGQGPQSTLGTPYLEQYDKAREMYLKGLGLLKMLKSGNAYREYPGSAPQLYTPELQRFVSMNRGELLKRLGPEDFATLVNAVYRGGELGSRDVLVPGRGGMLDALSAWMRGQNTGATQTVRVPVATALPNLGSQYTGRAPLTAPDSVKALLDILGISTTTGGTP